jgi:hypothetical protein
MKSRLLYLTPGLGALFLAMTSPAWAWWVKGHALIAAAAASRLPDEMPAFFRAGGKSLGYLAGEPDRWKNKETRFLNSSEYPEHFLDLEDLEGNELPSTRFKYCELIRKLGKQPEKVGLIPYALMDHHERLACAFADYRREPDNEANRMKCLVYAGVLAHYSGDVCMPLHTTRNYDGRPGPDGKLKQKGIHAKIDGFPEKFGFTTEEIAKDVQPKKLDDVWKEVKDRIAESHTHIDRCYELDLEKAFDQPTDESREFIMQRCRAAAQFTADLWYSAWLRSATLPPPF